MPEDMSEFEINEPPISDEDTQPNKQTKVIPVGLGKQTGGRADAPNFRRTNSEESEKIIEGEVVEEDFVSKVRDLMEGDEPELSDEWIQRQARLVAHPWGRTKKELNRILSEGNAKFSNGEINESEWAKFAGVVFEEKEKMGGVTKSTPERNRSKTEGPAEVKVVKDTLKIEEETPEAWARAILTQLDLAERSSESKTLRSYEQEGPWSLIDNTLEIMPDKLGQRFVSRDLFEQRYLESKYPEGFYLKERLQMYVEARKHVNDRYVEISKADGSLTAMGLGKDEVPFEGISYKLQKISPEDQWAIYHGDELFPELPNREKNELAPNVSAASELWLTVGIANRTMPIELLSPDEIGVLNKVFSKSSELNTHYANEDKDKRRKRKVDVDGFWPSAEDVYKVLGKTLTENELLIYQHIPTFDSSRNIAEFLPEIKARIRENLGSQKSEDLAYRMFSVWLAFELFDRNRTGSQGNSEPRDLMWSERKRVYELGDKEREPGVDWTIGRYFVQSPDQGSAISNEDANKSTKLAHRKEALEVNAERGIFIEPYSYFEGEVVSDFLHNNLFPVVDELVPGKTITRNMATYVINGDNTVRKNGFKDIPFLRMGQLSYSGYFGYTLGKAKQINGDLTAISWKDPKEMAVDDYWNKKRDLIERLDHISPRFNVREYKYRGELIRKKLLKDPSFNPDEVAKIVGFSGEKDLSVITDPALRRKAADLIKGPVGPVTRSNGRGGREEIRYKGKPVTTIADAAKYYSEKLWRETAPKIRMAHALGQIWTGSLDSIEESSNLVTASSITPDLMEQIIVAISSSRYLEGEYMEHFKYEALQEMAFGTKWSSGKRGRERRPQDIRPEKWEGNL